MVQNTILRIVPTASSPLASHRALHATFDSLYIPRSLRTPSAFCAQKSTSHRKAEQGLLNHRKYSIKCQFSSKTFNDQHLTITFSHMFLDTYVSIDLTVSQTSFTRSSSA
ncbi:hypothetical protein XPA_005682 [Xanthoria parietina]